jgi:hypothetical protein
MYWPRGGGSWRAVLTRLARHSGIASGFADDGRPAASFGSGKFQIQILALRALLSQMAAANPLSFQALLTGSSFLPARSDPWFRDSSMSG